MGKYDIGKYFQERVKGHSEALDTDAIWASLDLNEEKKDRRGLFFWFGLLTGIMVFGAGIFWLNKSESAISESTAASDQESVTKEIVAEQPKVQQAELDKDIVAASKSDVQNHSTEVSEKSKKLNINTAGNTLEMSNQVAKNQRHQIQSTAIREIQKTEASTTINSFITQKRNSTPSTPYVAPVAADAITEKAKDERSSLHREVLLMPFIQELPMPKLNIFEITERNDDMIDDNNDVALPNVILPKNKLLGSFTFYTGYYDFNRSLTALNGTDIEPFIQVRNNTESKLEVLELGAAYKLEFNSGLYLKAGLEFQSINERFGFDRLNRDTIDINGVVVERFLFANGDTTDITGAGLGIKTDTETWTRYNSHQLFNVPITLGYEWESNRWSLFIESSGILSVRSSFVGEQLDANFNVGMQDYFSGALNFGVAASAGVGYNLSPNLKIYAQPRYQKLLNSITKVSSQMDQRYEMFGLRVGVECKIY